MCTVTSPHIRVACRVEIKAEEPVDSEPHTQKYAPSKRAKDARIIKEEKKDDLVAEEPEPSVRKSTRVRKPAFKEVCRYTPHPGRLKGHIHILHIRDKRGQHFAGT